MTTTESRRFFLLSALGVILFFLYQAWQDDDATQPEPAETARERPVAGAGAGVGDDVPRALAPQVPANGAEPPADQKRTVTVETDVLRAEISLLGGGLQRVELKDYPVEKERPNVEFALLRDQPGQRYVLQSGLASTEQALVTHESSYSAAASRYVLTEGQDEVEVVLDYVDPAGYSAQKVYRFRRGAYEAVLEHRLRNGQTKPLTVSPYVRFVRTLYAAGTESKFLYTFTGVGLYEQKESGGYRFSKTDFEDLGDEVLEVRQTGGWIAFLQHYFVTAIIPPADEEHHFNARPARDGGYLAQYIGAAAVVPPGGEHAFPTRLYLGPKLQNRMGDVAPGLELTIDYGILTPIAEPLFWLLDLFQSWTRNWGAAIILLTVFVKLALYKLSEAQYRSMAKMKKFAPRIQELKERYGDDRERMQRAMMDLYKKEGFNPLAGCWPLLVQFPVFIALYWVLLESVELRHAEFILWLNDLSSPDPYYVLPVLFGLSMWFQQRLSGTTATMDPMQQRIMNLMPVMLTAFFAFFPVGLVLYWFVSNVIGIAQQWYITRKLGKEALRTR